MVLGIGSFCMAIYFPCGKLGAALITH